MFRAVTCGIRRRTESLKMSRLVGSPLQIPHFSTSFVCRVIVAIPGNKARGAVSTANLQGAFFLRWPCEWQIGLRFYASSSRHDRGSRLASGTNIADWSGEQPREDSAEFLHSGALKGTATEETASDDGTVG